MTPTAAGSGSRLVRAALRIPNWLITTPSRFIGLVIVMILSQWALFRADAVFFGIAGYATIDTQNGITREQAAQQIGSYSRQAIEAYELFAVIDYAFPLLASLLICSSVLWLLRVSNRVTRWRVPESLAIAGLLPFVADYLENALLAVAIATSGDATAIALALAAKGLKLGTLGLASGLQVAATVYAVAVGLSWLARRTRVRAG